MKPKTAAAIARAIDLMGGPVKAATIVGSSYQAIQYWRRAGVPVYQRPLVEASTNGLVPVESLGDDVKWRRVPAKDWPWNSGAPLADYTKAARSAAH